MFEYLFRFSQVILDEFKAQFEKDEGALITLLRFIDCVTMSSTSQLEQHRQLSSLKPDYTQAIVDLANSSNNLHVLKLTAEVLVNANSIRSWPAESKETQGKFFEFLVNKI